MLDQFLLLSVFFLLLDSETENPATLTRQPRSFLGCSLWFLLLCSLFTLGIFPRTHPCLFSHTPVSLWAARHNQGFNSFLSKYQLERQACISDLSLELQACNAYCLFSILDISAFIAHRSHYNQQRYNSIYHFPHQTCPSSCVPYTGCTIHLIS